MAKTEDLQICVRRLKEMFLSGNIEQQIQAAKLSVNILTKDVSKGDDFLQEDIIVTLAEAMAKMHNDLLKLIMQCLELLASRPKFFSDKHATYITDCLLRTLASCIKRRMFINVFHMAVKLLSNILESFGRWCSKVALDTCVNVERVLMVTMEALQSAPEVDGCEVVRSAGLVLCSVLRARLSMSLVATLCSTANTYLRHTLPLLPDAGADLASPSSRPALAFVTTVNNLFCSALRMFSGSQLCDAEVESLLETFQSYVLKSTSIILAVPMTDNTELLVSYVQMLKAMYDLSSGQMSLVSMSDKLAGQTLLRYLFELSCWASHRNEEQLKRTSLLVLGDMLYVLTVAYLPPVDEPSKLRQILRHGLRQMLSNPAQLNKHNIHFTLYYTIMIYLYFLILCFFRNPFISALSQHLLAFRFELRFNTKLSVKALWLIVAAPCLTPAGDFVVESSSQRSAQLVEVLEASGRTDDFFFAAYTQHPALLAWAFCCIRVPAWLQMRVIITWLKSDDYNNGILLKLLNRFPVAGCFLLDIMVQWDRKTADRAVKILQQCLGSCPASQQILVSLWNSLPTALACFHGTSVRNAGLLMSLACRGIPDVVGSSSVVRVAWNLVRALPQHDSCVHFHGEGFRLSSVILAAARKLRDKRVVSMYASSAPLLEMLRRAAMSESSYLTPLALQLLTTLLLCQFDLHIPGRSSVKLDCGHLLALLSRSSWSVATVCQFLDTVLSNMPEEPCVTLADPCGTSSLSPHFLFALYLLLQGFCAVSVPGAQAVYWQCLGAVLRHCCSQGEELACSLVTQPWHHKLVQFAAMASPDTAPHALHFCLEWLRCYQRHVLPPGAALATMHHRRYSLALRSSLLAQTLAHVSSCAQRHAELAPPALADLVSELQEMVLQMEKIIQL